ncbi:putative ABC transport system permease protein [Streptomyces sp. 3330]|uniref:ABC transporter permease n=1 Tax=Streptomyces sp. 3330 TaxID=2817755 RepID=UPI002855A4C4|nr:FtsX-like permease family protein [Streptomyces sp. 3330]MDR6974291.1 putative ABC transport system permease protein [Streptomyces sp. 3330]
MSWSGVKERPTLFTGAVVSVCLGVALVQSSLLLLLSAATLTPAAGTSPIQRMDFDEQSLTAVTVLSVTLGCAAFLAVFVISSTFAFTVTQRRRDLALIRLNGASPRQIKHLLLGQAVFLGTLGVAGGVPLGLATMQIQTWLLRELDFVPADFTGQFRLWAVPAAAAAGIGLSVLGVLTAARRAAQIRPLEALRDTAPVQRTLGRSRWITGGVFLVGATALIALAPLGGPAGGQAMAMCVSLGAVLAFTCFGPSLLPAIARLIPTTRSSTLAHLAKAELRDDAWRSASTAAPVIVLVGLLLGQFTALTSATAAAQHEQRTTTRADLVLEARGDAAARVAGIPGVAAVSTEIEMPAAVTTGRGETAYTELGRVLVISPQDYRRVHSDSGPLGALQGRAVAAGPAALGISSGDRVGLRIGDVDLGRLPVTAAVPARMAGGATLLLPAGLVPQFMLSDAASHSFITLQSSAEGDSVKAALSRLGAVSTLSEWIDDDTAARTSADTSTLTMVMGLGGVYALIGVVNTLIIAAYSRRTQLAATRIAGFSRTQTLAAAWLETFAVTLIGLLLGLLAAGGTLIAMAMTAASVTGTATVAVPWQLTGAVIVTVVTLASATSLAAAWAATRQRPVTLLAARE